MVASGNFCLNCCSMSLGFISSVDSLLIDIVSSFSPILEVFITGFICPGS